MARSHHRLFKARVTRSHHRLFKNEWPDLITDCLWHKWPDFTRDCSRREWPDLITDCLRHKWPDRNFALGLNLAQVARMSLRNTNPGRSKQRAWKRSAPRDRAGNKPARNRRPSAAAGARTCKHHVATSASNESNNVSNQLPTQQRLRRTALLKPRYSRNEGLTRRC